MKCPRCLAEIPAQSLFCRRCGTQVQGASPDPTRQAMPFTSSTPRSNTRLYAAILAVTLILGGIGIGALVAGNLTRKTDTVPPSQMVQAPDSAHSSQVVQAPAQTTP